MTESIAGLTYPDDQDKGRDKGQSTMDVAATIQELYDIEISPSLISGVTDRVSDQIKQCQGRGLEDVLIACKRSSGFDGRSEICRNRYAVM